jgi:hypothetical protein
MKTTLTSALLAIAFLSAGAFARAPLAEAQRNVTVVHKTSAMPLKARLTISPCEADRCFAI